MVILLQDLKVSMRLYLPNALKRCVWLSQECWEFNGKVIGAQSRVKNNIIIEGFLPRGSFQEVLFWPAARKKTVVFHIHQNVIWALGAGTLASQNRKGLMSLFPLVHGLIIWDILILDFISFIHPPVVIHPATDFQYLHDQYFYKFHQKPGHSATLYI